MSCDKKILHVQLFLKAQWLEQQLANLTFDCCRYKSWRMLNIFLLLVFDVSLSVSHIFCGGSLSRFPADRFSVKRCLALQLRANQAYVDLLCNK